MLFCGALVPFVAMGAGGRQVVPVKFAWTNNPGSGNAYFVKGSHAMLGGGMNERAHKMYNTSGNIWEVWVGLPPGETISYQIVSRSAGVSAWGGAGTQVASGSITVPGAPEAGGKTVYYYTTYSDPRILWNNNGTWTDATMEDTGAGLRTGERKWKVSGIGTKGQELEFVPHGTSGGNEVWDNPSGSENFRTSLDVFIVRDNHVFTYEPAASAPTDSQVITTTVTSTVNRVINRTMQIYLPRGYSQNTTRRYPVLYMQDGQNVFEPGGSFGCWYTEANADWQIQIGQMRECIIVGLECSTSRANEYKPNMDSGGFGDEYMQFLQTDVMPRINATYRTLTGEMNSGVCGSSSGGLIVTYLGERFPGVFGKVIAMSGVYSSRFVPNYHNYLTTATIRTNMIIWHDVGSEETNVSNTDLCADNVFLADVLQRNGFVHNMNTQFRVEMGAGHNEAAWAARLGEAMSFVFPATEDPGDLEGDPPPEEDDFEPPETDGGAYDYAGNYTNDVVFTDGSNGGTGFLPWETSGYEGEGWAGYGLWSSSRAALGMGKCFGFVAKGSNAWVNLLRTFAEPLADGDVFTLKFGINWDGNNSTRGNKGFVLMSGTNEALVVNNGGSAEITVMQKTDESLLGTLAAYGTNTMTWHFEQLSPSNVAISATGRDGAETLSVTSAVPGVLTGIKFYASELDADDERRQAYFNHLKIIRADEDEPEWIQITGFDTTETHGIVRISSATALTELTNHLYYTTNILSPWQPLTNGYLIQDGQLQFLLDAPIKMFSIGRPDGFVEE